MFGWAFALAILSIISGMLGFSGIAESSINFELGLRITAYILGILAGFFFILRLVQGRHKDPQEPAEPNTQ